MSRPRPLWWVPALGLMAAIWYFSGQPQTPGPRLVHPLDWGAHFLTYLALGFCLTRATGRRGVALVLAAWFGALDEVHQAFVPPREAGVTDWLFDVAGAWLGGRVAAPASRGEEENAGAPATPRG
ncbi:VanZ family protein [Deinococcus arcticus]|uniref:Antibiotic resistance protein VanZ n=1 Tax=Deinococcus arcticus TaxID=2136176 RepID=A0A2T3WAM6_9DEIO|nr:VanZ family protein [Deinococcus arcticus]PTA68955.1 antibiotic resistance protein VanZ [Deinococcus arcticus]